MVNHGAHWIDDPPGIIRRDRYTIHIPLVNLPEPGPHEGEYSGPWRYGRPMEKSIGSFKTPDFEYKGLWQNGNMQGTGECLWTDGKTYTGGWENNNMHGWGEYKLPDGTTYKGEFRHGLYYGKGEFTFAGHDEVWVKGEWSGEGVFYGLGHLTYHDTTGNHLYKGEVKVTLSDGLGLKIDRFDMHGLGERQWPDGEKYRGLFKDNVPHGLGELICANGHKYIAEFLNGVMLKDGIYARTLVATGRDRGPTLNFGISKLTLERSGSRAGWPIGTCVSCASL
eukprot:jgi/Botrbrau1/13325/Bobra.0334s0003.1